MRLKKSVIAMARSLECIFRRLRSKYFWTIVWALALYRGSASIISKVLCQRAGDSRSLMVEDVSAGACVLELSLLEILCPRAPCQHASLSRPPRLGRARL